MKKPLRIMTLPMLALGLSAVFADEARAWQRDCTSSEIKSRPEAQILMDAKSGEVLSGNNIDQRLFQASLTKRMTIFLALEALRNGTLKKDQLIRLTNQKFRNQFNETQDGDPVRFEFSQITVEHAMLAAILRSSNRAPLALAVAIAGSEEKFVERMNAKAKELGMEDTHFANSTGYPTRDALNSHYTTVRDHAKLVQALYVYFSEDMKEFRRARAELTGYKDNGKTEQFGVKTTVALMPGRGGRMSMANVLGGKTGTSCGASMIDVEAEIKDRNVIAVIAGKDRISRAYNLLARPGLQVIARLESIQRKEDEPLQALVTQIAPPEVDMAAIDALPGSGIVRTAIMPQWKLPDFNDCRLIKLNIAGALFGYSRPSSMMELANYDFLQKPLRLNYI